MKHFIDGKEIKPVNGKEIGIDMLYDGTMIAINPTGDTDEQDIGFAVIDKNETNQG